MSWKYSQATGRIWRNGTLVGAGYSGAGLDRNNPNRESIRDSGPTPRGRYRIGAPENTAAHGPHVLRLTPVGHNALGRSGCLIHVDNTSHSTSRGCIILGPDVRHSISQSGDTDLEVIR
jgi:hypothetical protein